MSRAATAAPAIDSVDAVQASVQAALADRVPVRVVGRGGWLDANRPVRAERVLALARVSGIVEYTAGDLTLTALAGTTLAEIAQVTASEGQFLALDPPGEAGGSLGAAVATASAGPLAHAFGLPRDNVLGVEFVTGTGTLVRGGGRVVKNVAGFDLTRLVTGSWGTLGVITEVTVRLRALPEASVTLAITAPVTGLAGWLARLRALPLAPYALELVDGALARALGVADSPVLLAQIAGNESAVASQTAALRSLGDALELPPLVWTRLRAAEPPAAAAVARFSALPGDLAATWSAALAVVRDAGAGGEAGYVQAAVGRGVVRCVIPAAPDTTLSQAFARSTFAGTRLFERLPATLWPRLAPTAVDTPLARRTRDAFDPFRILNPGILGESVAG